MDVPPPLSPSAPAGMAITRSSADVPFTNVAPPNFGNIVGDGLFVGSCGRRSEDVGKSVGDGVT
eukprot:scaffold24033_cov66-Skeletonema_marinoi.AAC.1